MPIGNKEFMIIRNITENDRQAFYELEKQFYCSGATHRPYNAAITEKTFNYLLCNHENLWGYLMEDINTGEDVGYALLTSYWCNEDGGVVLIIDEFFIAEDQRGKGYGTLFLEFVENEFKDKAVSITLEVVTTNLNAKNLYKKKGYFPDGFEVLTKKL